MTDALPPQSNGGNGGEQRHFAVLASLTWLCLALSELCMIVRVPGTIWQNEVVPSWIKVGLVSLDLALLLPLAFILALFVRVARAVGATRSAIEWRLARFLRTVLSGFLLLLYCMSWGAFLGTARFLDLAGLELGIGNFMQFLQHVAQMNPHLLVGAPLAAVLGTAVLTSLLPRAVVRMGRRSARFALLATAVAIVAVVCCAAYAVHRLPSMAGPARDPSVGMVYSMEDLSATLRDDRTGPALHLASELRRDLLEADVMRFADPSIPQTMHPVVTMEHYLAQVDQRTIRRYNVLLVLIESLRNDQLVGGGSARVVMPHVESLASNGRLFVNTYTQASHSNYADLAPLSSHYPLRSRRYHVYPQNPSYPRVLMYDVLHALGYRTAVVSSQNENWGGMLNYLRTPGLDYILHSENYAGPTYVPRADLGFAQFVKGQKRSGKIDDRYTVKEAIRWIEMEERPFFLYLNLQNSHVPYELPADFAPRFGPGKVDFPIVFGAFPPERASEVKDLYANSLAYVDAQLGKLLDYLRASRRLEETVIVVTGDNGQAFFEHGFAAHANALFNEVMRVPLVLHGPGVRPGIDLRLAEHVDVPPTVFHLLSLPPHPAFQGQELFAPVVPGRSVYLVAQAPSVHQYALVNSGFKLIYDARQRYYGLYDLQKDPGERRNLVTGMPRLTFTMARQLDTWRKAQTDFYERPDLYLRFYPPVLAEAPVVLAAEASSRER